MSLSCAQRGLFLQLILMAKEGENSVVRTPSYSALALASGVDDSTCAKYLGKFADSGKIEVTKDEYGTLCIRIVKFDFWQGVTPNRDGRKRVVSDSEKSPKNRCLQKQEAIPKKEISKKQEATVVLSPVGDPPSKTKRTPSGDHQVLIDFWMKEYRDRVSQDYVFEGKKDGVAVATILKMVGLEEAKDLVLDFLNTNDEWILNHGGLKLSILPGQINKLKQKRANLTAPGIEGALSEAGRKTWNAGRTWINAKRRSGTVPGNNDGGK